MSSILTSSFPSSAFEPWLDDYRHILANAKFQIASTCFFIPAVTVFLWFFVAYHTSPLKKYPGPFLAGWTNLWRLHLAYSAKHVQTMTKLHEKYGPVVRIGPNLLDLDYPELSRTVYNTDGKWKKTNFYQNSSSIINGKITYHMFSEVDNVEHAKLKRPVVRHYSVPRVQVMEPHMDLIIRDFCDHIQTRFVENGNICNLGDWLSYYAWDFLGKVTFSQPFGYMAAGKDFDGTLAVADQSIDYLGMCGQMPWLDHWLDKNPVVALGPPNISSVTRIAVENLTARLKGEDKNFDPDTPDFLQYFIESKDTHPEVVNEGTIIGYLLLNLIAGADTTAITMRALFYYCLKDQSIWNKLQDEVRERFQPNEPVPNSHARQCSYLEAVINETLRYHPAVSMTMERIVPEGGFNLPDGSHVPAGTFVGMNPYIVGRNKGIFGKDANDFRPDRWLKQDGESESAFQQRMQRWGTATLTFGGGSRICLGRNLSVMEVFKVVPTLIATFDIELEDPDEVWWSSSRWFYRTSGVKTIMRPRKA